MGNGAINGRNLSKDALPATELSSTFSAAQGKGDPGDSHRKLTLLFFSFSFFFYYIVVVVKGGFGKEGATRVRSVATSRPIIILDFHFY